MTVIPAGSEVPPFTLKREDGSEFTEADLQGTTTVLVFYPFAFSPVCTDQLQIYNEALPEITASDAVIYGVSTDPSFSQSAFREKLGVEIPQLSDFEPKGEACRVFGAFFEPGGMSNRALVIVGPDGRVAWSYLADTPGDLPGVNLIFDGLQAV
ncbi:MAG: redoxin domain-containing protein [Solirubrobacteraceae bacterium]|nr:redoxin domain-containing protein [Solirubrobacteraceae bacterium]